MTKFSINLRVRRILYIFKFAVEQKAGELPEQSRFEFSKETSQNNSISSYAENNTSRPLHRGGRAYLTLTNRSKFLGSERLPCFINWGKFGRFKNPKLGLRRSVFTLMIWTKEVIFRSNDNSTSVWKPWFWMRLYLILPIRDIYISSNLTLLTKFSSRRKASQYPDLWAIARYFSHISLPYPSSKCYITCPFSAVCSACCDLKGFW